MKKKIKKYIRWGPLGAIFVGVVFGLYMYQLEHRKPELEIYFFHLNRGRASFIRTPENKMILFGGGQTSEIIREITRLIPFYKRRLDYVVVPSASPDQIGGLIEIFDRYEIGEILIPKILATSTALTALRLKMENNKILTREVRKGDVVNIEKGLRLNILFPSEEFAYTKSNLPELGVSLVFDSISICFLGDLSKGIQKTLADDVRKANIVEYAHSAGDTAVSPELFEKLDPDYIVYTKKDSSRGPSKTKKKFDIDLIAQERKVNLEKEGTARFVSDGIIFSK